MTTEERLDHIEDAILTLCAYLVGNHDDEFSIQQLATIRTILKPITRTSNKEGKP